jgi:hypothetical protein
MQPIMTFIASVPKSIIAIVVLILGFVLIVYNDPPKTVCDSQMDLFRQSQKEFLYSRPGPNQTTQGPLLTELYELCQAGNSPGGCFEFFVRLKKMNQDLDTIPRQCNETAAEEKVIKTALLSSMKLMSRISWGDRGPASTYKRTAWLDMSDLAVYCGLKKQATRIYGKEFYEDWQSKVISSLPEAENLEPEQALQKSLFATPCDAYR